MHYFFFREEMPKRPAPVIGTAKDGSVIFQYSPTETGIHEMNVTYNEKAAEGDVFSHNNYFHYSSHNFAPKKVCYIS